MYIYIYNIVNLLKLCIATHIYIMPPGCFFVAKIDGFCFSGSSGPGTTWFSVRVGEAVGTGKMATRNPKANHRLDGG